MSRTKRTRLAFGLAGLAMLAVGIWYMWGHHVPAGQPPLTDLNQNNLSEFHAAFDGASASPRLVLLLSPT